MRRLPDALIDQIAAGEVVERPASVVKELVENALDAGAERLRVEVRNGGCDWIAVTDDGGGMTPEDARLALQRHATSKISAASDLQRIGTYGFRGEALPAIASVSSLRLRTRTRDAESAFELRVRAGEIGAARAVSGPIGTRVEVADLFAAIPARRKFLKSAQTEWGHIADWLARSALALPSVHFDILRDERAALAWPAARDPLDRIATILGEREASALQRV
ncbi:MAG: DNA mismatch repair endonuclease MutL, partial [Myxococcales bacterium]|nr:DNA mismatch repair endonuclease MutL [Myxococcales bacterium]